MDFTIIVAIAKNNAIGKNNDLLWHISGDLKRFKEITTGHTVIMGSNTYLSLPKRPLPNRRNIVISKRIPDNNFEGATVVKNIEEAIKVADPGKENFIIGGGMIYNEFMPLSNKIYLTLVERDYDADTFFPQINYDEWEITDREEHPENDPPFSYLTLIKK